MAVPILRVPENAAYQTARTIRKRYGTREWTLNRFAVAGQIRTSTQQVPVTLYHVDDLMRVLEEHRSNVMGDSVDAEKHAAVESAK